MCCTLQPPAAPACIQWTRWNLSRSARHLPGNSLLSQWHSCRCHGVMPGLECGCNVSEHWQWRLELLLAAAASMVCTSTEHSLKVQVPHAVLPLLEHRAAGWRAAGGGLPREHEAVAAECLPLPGGNLAGIEARSPQHPHSCGGGRQKVSHLLHRVVVQGLPRSTLPHPGSASACRRARRAEMQPSWLPCMLKSLQPMYPRYLHSNERQQQDVKTPDAGLTDI